jgi:tRNA(Ile)-lysidine synthase
MKKTEQKIIEFIERHSLVKRNDKLLIAISGGPDSVFALYFFNKFRKKYGIELFAVHFNHNLRNSESDNDEKFTLDFCEKFNVPLYIVDLDVKKIAKENKISIEEAARKLRYKYLYELADEFKCTKIVTAHNQSDNTETVLLNVVSGTGIRGFSGIPIKRDKIIRPILCLPKHEILSYLKTVKIPFRLDSSNSKNNFERNFLRNKVIPLIRNKINPSIDSAVFRSSKTIENSLDFINKKINLYYKRFVCLQPNAIKIDLEIFDSKYEKISGDVLSKALYEIFNYEFSFIDFIKINSLSKKNKGRTIQLKEGLIVLREKNYLIIKPNLDEEINESISVGEVKLFKNYKLGIERIERKDLNLNSNKSIEYIDGGRVKGNFRLRLWKSGDRFIPYGMSNYRKVSDFLTDAKILSSSKKTQLVLTNRNHIVWVVGLRIDDRFKITPKTKKIYKLWIN